ncbi:ATP-dependent helicase HrpB [Candidatus Halocynthiibacter alkanivorans]|uniref:ATP-dependent helicase HrpB n=1 Tax=Candidatus Halocynthiibacter alkanivorans TaxID=2267619 RepID=UPI003AF3ED60
MPDKKPMTDFSLPIDAVIPEFLRALSGGAGGASGGGLAVLQAPPGAGKTTRVPLAMLEAGLVKGRILMLEPRRLAARAAAERMADTLGERVGETVGYRIRGEAKVSKATRIEVVTEGILTRMIQGDAELPGIGAVIFDEFHERSLNADLGLALCLEIRDALREDLMIVVMSATLDAAPVAALMRDAPLVTSEGRAFAVETTWLERPLDKRVRIAEAAADLVVRAVSETDGGVLVFLPGEGEIRRAESALAGRLPKDVVVRPLFGAMEFKAQRAAIAPAASGRKVVLATAIAETSLTIQDIRVVVDAGQSRRARFDPGSGMSRLITERVTKAEAEQRRGRAGRVAEGHCYRMWTRGEEGGMLPFPPAEIEATDLAGLALELALWGAAPKDLPFLTQPGATPWGEAVALLQSLGALDQAGRISRHGRALSKQPLHPRLAHMLQLAGGDAALLAAFLADRDFLRGAPVDLSLRMEALEDARRFAERRPWQASRGAVERIKTEAKRLRRGAGAGGSRDTATSLAMMAALAYPDRIGLRRKGDAARYVLSGGKGAVMSDTDPMAGARLIVATDLDGNPREAKIRQAVEIPEAEVRELFADQISWIESCAWSKRDKRVVARRREMLGAVMLADQIWKDAPREAVALGVLAGFRELRPGLSAAAERFRARVALLRDDHELPDMGDAVFYEAAEDWLLPYLAGIRSESQIRSFDLLEALRGRLNWAQTQLLDREAPAHFITPMGHKAPIDYAGEHPGIEVRLQEMFGLTRHPCVGRTPLRVTLLSPARRPVQVTMDLPGFWASSYGDVRKDMRGQYPRHPWPEDPTTADPTLRAKRRR